MIPLLGLIVAVYAFVRLFQIPLVMSIEAKLNFWFPESWRVAAIGMSSLAGMAVIAVLAVLLVLTGVGTGLPR